MAKATPVTAASSDAQAPEAAAEIVMAPAAQPTGRVSAAPAVIAPEVLEAMLAESLGSGASAQLAGNAVRVDN